MVDRLTAIKGIADAQLTIMKLGKQTILLVGVREDSTPANEFRQQPSSSEVLPDEMIDAYEKVGDLRFKGMQEGIFGEDNSNGHSLAKYEPQRDIQKRFIASSKSNFQMLRQVLLESKDDQSREAAAEIIAYSPDKAAVGKLLGQAMSDAASNVRNNAARALAILSAYSQDHPELKIEVDPTPFLAMMESIVFTDRNKGAMMIEVLTRARPESLLNELRKNRLDTLSEMARWHSLGHANFSIIVLGRLAGLTDKEINIATLEKRADRRVLLEWIESLVQSAKQKINRTKSKILFAKKVGSDRGWSVFAMNPDGSSVTILIYLRFKKTDQI